MLRVPRDRAFIPGGTPPQFDTGHQFGAYQHRPHGTPVFRYTWKSPWMKSGREEYCKRLRDWLTIRKIANRKHLCVATDISSISNCRVDELQNQSSITRDSSPFEKTKFISPSNLLNFVKFIRLSFNIFIKLLIFIFIILIIILFLLNYSIEVWKIWDK